MSTEQKKMPLVVYESGAKRANKLPMYRLIPMALLADVADALTEGHEKYCGGPWDSNWRRDKQEYFIDTIDHLIEHLFMWITITFDRTYAEKNFSPEQLAEDHLAHLAANVALISWANKMGVFIAPPTKPIYKDGSVTEDFEQGREITEALGYKPGKKVTIPLTESEAEAESGTEMQSATRTLIDSEADAKIGIVHAAGSIGEKKHRAAILNTLLRDQATKEELQPEAETQNSMDSPAEAEVKEVVLESEPPPSPSSDDKWMAQPGTKTSAPTLKPVSDEEIQRLKVEQMRGTADTSSGTPPESLGESIVKDVVTPFVPVPSVPNPIANWFTRKFGSPKSE